MSQSSKPVHASFPSERLTIGAGVAIFHLASEKVVLCYHTRDKYWFLPKGRKNANEAVTAAAEREGYEESGYRNRLLPLPLNHRATDPDEGHQRFVTEPIWTQFLPLSSRSQYLLFWYAAETLSSEIEESFRATDNAAGVTRPYQPPPAFPVDTTLTLRIAQDVTTAADGKRDVYQPFHHPNTSMDDGEEEFYESYLIPIEEAQRRLRGGVMSDVVRRAWEAIQLRLEMEKRPNS